MPDGQLDMEVMVDKGDSGHWTDMVAVFWEMWESAGPHGPRRGPELKKNTHLFC